MGSGEPLPDVIFRVAAARASGGCVNGRVGGAARRNEASNLVRIMTIARCVQD